MSETADPAIVLARFVVFGLAILLFGGASFAVYAPEQMRGRPGIAMGAIAPLLLSLAAAGYVGLLAREARAEPGWPPLALLADIAATTGFGRALAATLFAGLGLAVLGAFGPKAAWVRLALSGSAVAALAFVGHAADDGGVKGDARLTMMALHLLAIGVWLGALPWLWRALRAERGDPFPLLSRFGLASGISVALVLATGLGTLGFMLADARAGLGAGYARVLIVKLACVFGLFVLAGVNRFWLTPRMALGSDWTRQALRRTIVLEQALGLCALASVSLLGQLDPTM